jgi:hypothetical protein
MRLRPLVCVFIFSISMGFSSAKSVFASSGGLNGKYRGIAARLIKTYNDKGESACLNLAKAYAVDIRRVNQEPFIPFIIELKPGISTITVDAQ